MSSIYITEPPTKGKVLLKTSFGDLDVELWPKEAPKACRNFVQLCMEGYYDNCVFHRLVKDFMIQCGDPSGTGSGGSSIWGKPFKDEIHTRLKFSHRGLLAMANENKPNTNSSQFFFTFGPCEWIQGTHTIFGKITGNTIFNLLSIKDMETDESDRPVVDPLPYIKSIEILDSPFDDIVARAVTAPIQKTKHSRKKEKKRKVKLNTSLLSFTSEEAQDALAPKKKNSKTKKKKMKNLKSKEKYCNKKYATSDVVHKKHETSLTSEMELNKEDAEHFQQKMRNDILIRQAARKSLNVSKNNSDITYTSKNDKKKRKLLKKLNEEESHKKTQKLENGKIPTDKSVSGSLLQSLRANYSKKNKKLHARGSNARMNDTMARMAMFRENMQKKEKVQNKTSSWASNKLKFVKHWEDGVKLGKGFDLYKKSEEPLREGNKRAKERK